MNIAYRHLREPLRHSQGCGTHCAKGCAVAEFDEALAQPITQADREADERWRRNAAALMRGEIPGREVRDEPGQPADRSEGAA